MRFAVLIAALTCSACDLAFPLEFFDPIPHIPEGKEDVGAEDAFIPNIGINVLDTTSDEPTRMGFDKAVFEPVKQDGASTDVLVMRAAALRIEGVIQIIGDRPLIIIAQTIEIAGTATLDASAVGIRAGPGGGRPEMGDPGEGGAGLKIAKFQDHHSGGGGGGFAFGAGAGGKVDCGGKDLDPGPPGPEIGDKFLVLLQGGGAGGRGGFDCANPLSFGGAGGGAIQLSAVDSITIEGSVLAGGGGGLGGPSLLCPGQEGAGSGGGAGGAIYIDAPRITNTGRILAHGGGGGGGGDDAGNMLGAGNGDNGSDANSAGLGLGGPASGVGTSGGDGSTGGVAQSGITGNCATGGLRFNTGGGGGAPGRIVFRGLTDMAGTVSPTQEEPPRSR